MCCRLQASSGCEALVRDVAYAKAHQLAHSPHCSLNHPTTDATTGTSTSQPAHRQYSSANDPGASPPPEPPLLLAAAQQLLDDLAAQRLEDLQDLTCMALTGRHRSLDRLNDLEVQCTCDACRATACACYCTQPLGTIVVVVVMTDG